MLAITFISVLLMALYGILIIYYRWAWHKIPDWSPPATTTPAPVRITVLIPARNEENNILHCLASLARQSYPKELFEVIVIDDHSTDATAKLVTELAATSPLQLTCLHLSGHGPNPTASAPRASKKFAIGTGIAAAKGALIVTTDADCWSGPDWLYSIATFYESTGAKFIAAPVRIEASPPRRHSCLFLLQTLDFITLQGITGASVSRRIHSMCNGANLAYEKSAFGLVDGFRGIDNIPSGDDMLLMHKIYKRYPGKVFFLKSRAAIVSTHAASSWNAFLHQRIRWASKATVYDDRRIFWVLLLVYLVNLLFPLLLLASCWNRWYLLVVLLLGIAKTFIEFPFTRIVAAFFGQQRLMIYFPCLQPFHIAYTVIVGWLGQFGSYKWKDRNVRRIG
jgi:cellulose synthase/poly-beta-1,6-N-acetylglucosamine synthase-like glycosyltransferase